MAAPPLSRASSAPGTPIGVEQTASGYEVAWKSPGVDLYSIWNTDSNGNFLSYRQSVGQLAPRWKRWRLASIRI